MTDRLCIHVVPRLGDVPAECRWLAYEEGHHGAAFCEGLGPTPLQAVEDFLREFDDDRTPADCDIVWDHLR